MPETEVKKSNTGQVRPETKTSKPETKEVKRENFENVDEALAGAGSTVLAHLDSNAHKLTREEVDQHEQENPKEVLGYGGPYTDEDDQRNMWTADQTPEVAAARKEARERREKEQQEKEKEREREQREREKERQPQR